MQSVASQDLRYGGSGDAIPTVAINAAGGLLFAALFTADQRAADTRISRRDKVTRLAEGPAAFLIMTDWCLRHQPPPPPPPLHGACLFSCATCTRSHGLYCYSYHAMLTMQAMQEASIVAQGGCMVP